MYKDLRPGQYVDIRQVNLFILEPLDLHTKAYRYMFDSEGASYTALHCGRPFIKISISPTKPTIISAKK